MFQQFDRDRDRDRGRDRDRDRDRDRNRRSPSPFDILRFFTPGFPIPPSQGPQFNQPPGPPPAFIPQQPIGIFAVDPGAIRNCLFRFTYIWPHRDRGFWMFPTFVGPRSVAGFRWTGFNWVYFGMDLRDIQSFTCV